MSFTDEQLLNLVNNTILKKSEYDIKDFTGGGVQTTSTYSHKIIKHKIYLTFGYDEKRNSKSYSEDIDEDISFIWHKAILLKVKSMQVLKTGCSLSDLNELMNTDNKIEIVDNKIEDRDRARKQVLTTSLRTPKENKQSLKIQIDTKLSEYNNINLEAFTEWMDYKKYKAIGAITKVLNFLSNYDYATQQQIVDTSIMNNYKGLFEPKKKTQQTQSFKQQDIQRTDTAIDAFLNARDNGFDLRNMQDEPINEVEVIER